MTDWTPAAKEELALMVLLWKDFKCSGQIDYKIAIDAMEFAKRLGVLEEYNELLIKLPPMRIEPRYPQQ